MSDRSGTIPDRPDDDSDGDDFATVARSLQAQTSVQHTLDVICRLAVHAIDGAAHAGVTVRRGAAFDTPAASDDVPPLIDAIQYDTGQGPCLDTIEHEQTTRADDLHLEHRWPRFTSRVLAETGVRSMLSYRLFLQDDTLGALNLYSTDAGAFTARRADALGAAFAAHAAVALQAAVDHAQVEHLTVALATSRRIGAAVGILMCRLTITEDAAFGQLRTASQTSNRKLRDIADDVVRTGLLPAH